MFFIRKQYSAAASMLWQFISRVQNGWETLIRVWKLMCNLVVHPFGAHMLQLEHVCIEQMLHWVGEKVLQFVHYFCGMVFGKYLRNEMS